jgi:hypothetical protein
MQTFSPIPGIYNSKIADFLPHAVEALRNVVSIYHDYDHTLLSRHPSNATEQIEHPKSVDGREIDAR